MQLPLHIPQLDGFTDDELVKFCLANPELTIERDENGILYISHLLRSSSNSELNGEIGIWNRKAKAGKVIDSNGGFFLKDKSMKAPDVAWIRRKQWDALSKKEKQSFPHLAPDFVLELATDSDNLDVIKEKMEKWLANGVRLAWLISPEEKLTYIYKSGRPVETKAFMETLSGEDVMIGFETVLGDILEE